MGSAALILRANWVLPISSEPIQQGEVVIEADRIVEVRSQQGKPNRSELLDLGDAILLPGLVNVHAHLEYTHLRGQVEQTPFFLWIRQLVELKKQVPPEAWLPSALLGAAESIAGGITTVADNTDTGVTVEALARSGLRGRVYQEVFGLAEPPTDEQVLQELEAKLAIHRRTLERWEAQDRVGLGVAPHAVYTVRRSLLAAIAEQAQREGWFLSIHAAESSAEVALTRSGSGEFADMFALRGIPWVIPRLPPIEYLQKQGLLYEKSLLVHCVKVEPEEIRLMARSGCAIAHCPRSNAKLLVGIMPLPELLHAGLRIGLGTDSVVSSQSFDLFEEMRCAAWLQRATRYTAKPTPAQWVQMATLGGAQALGMEEQIGTLQPGKKADLCAVRTTRTAYLPMPDPYTALVFAANAQDVCLTMVDGRILYQDGKWHTLTEEVFQLKAP